MRHHGGHFADGCEPVAKPFAFLDLLDVGEVLEEQRRANRFAVIVAHQRQRVTDHRVGRLEAQLRAIRQRLQFERAAQHAHDVGMFVEKIRVELSGHIARRQPEQPPRFIVQEDDSPGTIDSQDAVAHVSHHVAEEHVR